MIPFSAITLAITVFQGPMQELLSQKPHAEYDLSCYFMAITGPNERFNLAAGDFRLFKDSRGNTFHSRLVSYSGILFEVHQAEKGEQTFIETKDTRVQLMGCGVGDSMQKITDAFGQVPLTSQWCGGFGLDYEKVVFLFPISFETQKISDVCFGFLVEDLDWFLEHSTLNCSLDMLANWSLTQGDPRAKLDTFFCSNGNHSSLLDPESLQELLQPNWLREDFESMMGSVESIHSYMIKGVLFHGLFDEEDKLVCIATEDRNHFNHPFLKQQTFQEVVSRSKDFVFFYSQNQSLLLVPEQKIGYLFDNYPNGIDSNERVHHVLLWELRSDMFD